MHLTRSNSSLELAFLLGFAESVLVSRLQQKTVIPFKEVKTVLHVHRQELSHLKLWINEASDQVANLESSLGCFVIAYDPKNEFSMVIEGRQVDIERLQVQIDEYNSQSLIKTLKVVSVVPEIGHLFLEWFASHLI